MKEKKILFQFVFILFLLGLYPTAGKVVEIDRETDTFTIETFSGQMWIYEGVEDWEVNDYCAMIMDSNDTESIYDDVISDIKYIG